MNWCLIIPIIVGAICALLGYLLGRLLSKNNSNDNTIEIDTWKKKYTTLESDFNNYKSKRSSLEEELSKCKANLAQCNTDLTQCRIDLSAKSNVDTATSFTAPAAVAAITTIPFDKDAAKAVFGKKIKQDDLKVVEGIGPKIQELFQNHDIKTWKALSECSVEKCQQILKSGGKRFEIHRPGTWPKQAKLAYEGKWEELLKWQDELDGGK